MRFLSLVGLGIVGLSAVSVEGFLAPSSTSFLPKLAAGTNVVQTKLSKNERLGYRSTLCMTDSSMNSDSGSALDKLKVKDPIRVLWKELRTLDLNTVVNTGILLCVVLFVLTTLTTVDSGMMRGWTVEEMAYRIPIDNWQSYSTILQQAPISTKAVTSATVYTIGDVIAQTTEGTTIGELDRPRILRSLLAGLIGHGPLSHVWYDWSEGIFNNLLHWTQWWSFIPKVVIDQATWGPFWNNTYILLLGLMRLEGWESIWSEMKRTTVPLIVSGLKLWPLAHCITYGLVPVENRLLWVDMVEIVWVTILATAAAGAAASTPEAEDESAEPMAT